MKKYFSIALLCTSLVCNVNAVSLPTLPSWVVPVAVPLLIKAGTTIHKANEPKNSRDEKTRDHVYLLDAVGEGAAAAALPQVWFGNYDNKGHLVDTVINSAVLLAEDNVVKVPAQVKNLAEATVGNTVGRTFYAPFKLAALSVVNQLVRAGYSSFNAWRSASAAIKTAAPAATKAVETGAKAVGSAVKTGVDSAVKAVDSAVTSAVTKQ